MTAGSSLNSDGGVGDIRDKLREAIWSATDVIEDAAKESKLGGSDADGESPLASLGKALMELDEKYFGKYVAATPTTAYLGSLAAPPIPAVEAAPQNSTGGPGGDDKMASVAAVIEEVAKDIAEVEATAEAAVKELVAKAVAAAPVPAMPATAKIAKDGTVDLQRPEKVQSVFDELQKAAVSMYKDAVGTGTTKEAAAVAAPVVDKAKLEESLETLLKGSSFSPAAMPAAQKQQLVQAVASLEASYPAGAAPLADPALSGQWSLVYSSSGGIFKAMLGKKRSKLFRVVDPLQEVDAAACTVTNTCGLRLRFTPLTFAMSQIGSYVGKGGSAVEIDFKRGRLARILAPFRKGSVSASLTYVSDTWRICRSQGCILAFRKVTATEA